MSDYDWGAVLTSQPSQPAASGEKVEYWTPRPGDLIDKDEPTDYLQLARQIAGTIANAGALNFLDDGLDLVSPRLGQKLRDDIKTLDARYPTGSGIASAVGTAASPANALLATGVSPFANTLISTVLGGIEGAGAAEGDIGNRLINGALPSAAISLPASGIAAGLASREGAYVSQKIGRKIAEEIGLDPSKIPSGPEIGALRELIVKQGKLTPDELEGLAGAKSPFPETQIDSTFLHMDPTIKKYIERAGQADIASSRAIGQALEKSKQQLAGVGENISKLYENTKKIKDAETKAGYDALGLPSVLGTHPDDLAALAFDPKYLVALPNEKDAKYLLPQPRKNAKGGESKYLPQGAKLLDQVRRRTLGFENYPDNNLLLLEEAYQVANNKSGWKKLFEGVPGANTDFNSTEARKIRGMLRTWLDEVAPNLNKNREKISINMNRLNAIKEGEDFAKSSLRQDTKRELPWFMKKQERGAEDNPYVDKETKDNFFKGYLGQIAKGTDDESLSVLRTQLKDPEFQDNLRGLWGGDEESFQGFLKNAEILGRARPANRIIGDRYPDPNDTVLAALIKDGFAASAGSIYARINLAHGLAKQFGMETTGELERLARLMVSPDDKVVEFAIKSMKSLDNREKALAISNAVKIGAGRGVGQEVLQEVDFNE